MRAVSNVVVATHSWSASIDKINEMAYLFSTSAVTVEANTAGATTTGNAHIIGNFSASLLAATEFRGGNVASSANLAISSNLTVAGNSWINGTTMNVAANANFLGSTNVAALGASGLATLTTVNVTSTAELRGVTTLYANVIPTNNAALIQVGRSTGRVLVFANTIDATGAIATTANVNGASGIFTGNVTVSGDANVAGNLNVTGTLTFIGTSSSDFTPTANITYYLGNTTKVWLGMHTKGLLANSTDTIFRTNRVDLPASTNTIASVRITPSAADGVSSLTAANGDLWVNAVNSTLQVLQIHIGGAVQNVAFRSSTVNAATQLETTRYIKLTGDATGQATFNGTANADITVTVGTVATATNATQLNGQAASYYTDIAARLGYTPYNKAGETSVGASTFAGNLNPTSNAINLGNTTQRWIMYANTLDVQSTATFTGVAVFNANLHATQRLFVTNIATFANTVTVTGAMTCTSTLAVTGDITGTLAGTANNATYLNGQNGNYYTNAGNLDAGTVPDARLGKANSTANGILMVVDSVSNTSTIVAAAANAVKQAYTYAGTIAGTAYSNAITFSANATNLGNGTVPIARIPVATSGEFRSNTVNKVLTTDIVWAEANVVSLTDGANVAVDFNAAFNFTLTLAGNRHLDNPTNIKPGQSGLIIVKQDATGSRTLAFGSYWKFPGGSDPTMSTTASAFDVISYFAANSTFIVASCSKAFA